MNEKEINEAFDREYNKYKNSPDYKAFVKIKMPTYYIAKHSDEDLRAAVLAEREACAKLCEDLFLSDGEWCAKSIRARDMSTKQENSDTSEECVHESDKFIHQPWVNLTDEEIAQAVGSPIDEVYLADFRRVIEKLRSKNT